MPPSHTSSVDHRRQQHREQTLLLLHSPRSSSKTAFDPEPPSQSHGTTMFPKKLFRRVPSCPSLNLHKLPKRMSIKFRERLSLVHGKYSSSVLTLAQHNDHDNDIDDIEGHTHASTSTPRTSGSTSPSESEDDVTVVGSADIEEKDGVYSYSVNKVSSKISYRKILQHVPGFSDEEEESQGDASFPTQNQHQNQHQHQNQNQQLTMGRRHSVAVSSPKDEVFWGMRATPYHPNHHDQQLHTALAPPPWHKPKTRQSVKLDSEKEKERR